jgi:Periplasmic component of the Tol biopolymer transport system
MRLNRTLLLLAISSFCFLNAYSQFLNYGTDPSSFKWRQINTEHYKLIYPIGNDSVAYRYANFLETIYLREQKTMGLVNIRRYPVILHPANMQSNGLVSWAPRRMELLTSPSNSLESQSWDKHLSIHESRHVMQVSKLTQGLFKPLYYIAGEQAAGIATFFVPRWFLEGDAVSIETAISDGGRGRLPEFNMTYRTQMLSGNFFSFDKWFLGSYKDYVGTFYTLGYDMTAFARMKYGPNIWNDVAHSYTRHISFPPFSSAIKRSTGYSTNELFKQTYAYLEKEWRSQDSLYLQSNSNSQVIPLLAPSSTYTSYRYPVDLGDSSIVALKSGLKDISSLVVIKGREEKHLTYVGNINSRLVLNKGFIYWLESVPGLRWTHENYSVLKSYNLKTNKIRTIAAKQRFIAFDIDKGGDFSIVSENTINGENRITFVNLEDGTKGDSFTTPENSFVKDIVFLADDKIAMIAISDRGLSVLQYDLNNGIWNTLLGPTAVNVTSLYSVEGQLFFESGLSGINNIYSLNLSSSQILRVTNSRFGAFYPSLSVDESILFYSDYDSNGYGAVSVPMSELKPEIADFDKPYQFSLAETLKEQEGFNLDTVTLKRQDFEVKPYSKTAHLFNIHSWLPLFYDISDVMNMQSDNFSTIVKPGAMVLSQNHLNTLVGQLGYYYENREHHGKLALTYMGLFPVIDLNVDYGGKAFDLNWTKTEDNKDAMILTYNTRKLIEAEARVYIPFNFSDNHIIRGLQPSLNYYYTNNKYQQYRSGKMSDFQYLLSELRYYNYRRIALRDIYPRYGFQVRLQHMMTPFNTENYGNLYAVRLTTYLPGLVKGNGLMIRTGYQYQDLEGKVLYMPKQLIEEPRGHYYNYQTHQQFAFKADYSFNLFYPEVDIAGLLYMKRFRSNVFYDITKNKPQEYSGWQTYSSYGADFIVDCNFFRAEFPISLGIRIANPVEFGNIHTSGLFSVSF